MKAYDSAVRNTSIQAPALRDLKMEPLRRKGTYNANIQPKSTTRRIGDELRRIGHQATELPRLIDDEKNNLTSS